MSKAVGRAEWPPESSHYSAGKCVGSRDVRLLSDDRSRGELKAIPATRNSQSRVGPDMRSQPWISSQGSCDGRPVRVQVEHCADTLNNEEERTRLVNLNAYIQCITARVERDLQISAVFIHGNRAAKAAASDDFHAGRGLGREELQDSFPIVGRAKVQVEEVLIFVLARHFLNQATDLSWRSMIDVSDGGVESAHGAKAPSERDLHHGQVGLVDELLGKVQTASLRNGAGRCPQGTQKQAPKMARAHSEVPGQGFHAPVFQTRLADQPQGSRNRILRARPSARSRRAFPAATPARAQTGFRCSSGARKVPHIFFLRRTRTTDRAAVDPRAQHANKELTVAARITCQSRSRTHPQVQIHSFCPSRISVMDLRAITRRFRN